MDVPEQPEASRLMVEARMLRHGLSGLLDELEARQQKERGRLLAGLAGIPGSGKSTFAAALAVAAERRWGPGWFAAVGMDGWHYPNAFLQARQITLESGESIPLRRLKGGPESFDVGAFVQALKLLRDASADVSVPVYGRQLHEPVAGALRIPALARIVLIEGNYLLSDAPPWDQASTLLAPRLFLICDEALARQRVIARHIRGGMSPAAAEAKYQENDHRNTRIILATMSRADMLIEPDSNGDFTLKTVHPR